MDWWVWLMAGKVFWSEIKQSHKKLKLTVCCPGQEGLGCFSVGFPSTMIGTYSRFIWCYKVFPSFINQCLPPFTFGFVFWKSVPLQNLNMRLYLQFVWVTSIIITYSNTTPVLSNHIFCFFLSVSFNNNFAALFTFCLQIFHLQTSQKNDVIQKFKVQFATHEKWQLKLGDREYSACNMLEIVGSS